MEPGKYYSVPHETYLSIPYLSAHGIVTISRKTMKHFAAEQPREPTAAMKFGSAVHYAILEPELFRHKVFAQPDVDKRTKAGRAIWDNFAASLSDGAIVLPQEQYDAALACAESVRAHRTANRLLANGDSEVVFIHKEANTGMMLKARMDFICRDLPAIVEVKTAADASPSAFGQAAGKYGYHIQAALYREIVMQTGGGICDVVFIVIETEPPYCVAVYSLDDDTMQHGLNICMAAIEKYKKSLETNYWPGYPDEITELRIPGYYL